MVAPTTTKLRERLMFNQLARLEALDDAIQLTALQASREDALSRAYAGSLGQHHLLLSEARARAKSAYEATRRQAEEIRAPLVPSRVRDGFFRKDTDRVAAILGFLQRERSQNASLSREQFDRAKAMAAKRSRADLRQAYRKSGHKFPSAQDLTGVDVSAESLLESCADVERKQRMRREVMAARGLFRGYTSHKHRRLCVMPDGSLRSY